MERALSDCFERLASIPTLFRGNSATSRLLSVYARTHGFLYLRRTLSGLVTELFNKPPDFSLEADSVNDVQSVENASQMSNLQTVAEAFLSVIASTYAETTFKRAQVD